MNQYLYFSLEKKPIDFVLVFALEWNRFLKQIITIIFL